ncbi:HAD domain-containing protein [Butyrivibrio sp.]|uniref:HAD domain-containing protein n=1 Tax=Butyrivibrio sp. TaxID=28121 RepID=UPI0025C4F693|nr:HAD domain-containing protein [Butyrivibrio sp.]MBQ9302338.1 hypothetical protein [Butyrivibrio sp.]
MTIFFDVDGVLNTQSDWQYKYVVNPVCAGAFAELIQTLSKRVPVQLVICSTWRAGIGKCDADSKQMQNLRAALQRYGLHIADSTPISNKGRQAEIEYYIRRHEIQDYLVIDDDPSLFERPDDLILYTPNYRTGFTTQDVKTVLKLLKSHRR